MGPRRPELGKVPTHEWQTIVDDTVDVRRDPGPRGIVPTADPDPSTVSPVPNGPLTTGVTKTSTPDDGVPDTPIPVKPDTDRLSTTVLSYKDLYETVHDGEVIEVLGTANERGTRDA